MYSSGVRRIRVPVNWEFIQPEQGGKLNLWWLDRVALFAALYKIDLLPFVLGAPGWAAASTESCVRCLTRPEVSATQPRDPAQFAKFVGALVTRYGRGGMIWKENRSAPAAPVRAWQIWNEPDLPSYWQSDSWAAEYGTLLRLTRAAIRKRDAKATIVLAGLTNYSPTALTTMLREGKVAGFFDVAAMNMFTKEVNDQAFLLQEFRLSLIRGGVRAAPVWITEWTWLSGIDEPPWSFPPVVHGADLTTRIGATVALYGRSANNGDGLQRAYWYSWATPYVGVSPFDYAGLMQLRGDGSPLNTSALAGWASAMRKRSAH